jgi:superfamily I DNA/RNA helicase/very-short-patch-repair endonuclease
MTEALRNQEPATVAVPLARMRPRLLVFETPSADALVPLLDQLFPDLTPRLQHDWRSPRLHHPERALPVWHLPAWDRKGLVRHAPELVREFAHPLATRGLSYVASFPFSKDLLEPAELDIKSLSLLDAEDVLKLLAVDALPPQTFQQLPLLGTQAPLTPIEEELARAFERHGIAARPQVRFGRFIVDFLVEENGSRFVVEADGAAYHDVERDAARDRELRDMGVTSVIRFAGREILRDANACASRVRALVHETSRNGFVLSRQSLDPGQTRAVKHTGAAARVLAPAGAGKTRVLVERVAELVERGVSPPSILALAFNRKANEQLVAELVSRGVPVSAKRLFDPAETGVRCATFNAFGFRYQRERLQLNFALPEFPTEWRKLMEEAVRESGHTFRGTRRGSDPLLEFLRARERACADLTDPDEIEVELEAFDGKPPIVIPYAPVDREFERLRVGRKLQSFDDQLATTVKELLRSPRERAFVQAYFSHVLVDEFQDLNAAQLALVDIITRPWRDAFVVGDDDQLIYGWRYARLTNILDFERRSPSASTYVLSTNYRCSSSVVDASSRLIAHNRNRVPKEIRTREGARPGAVEYLAAPSYEARAAALVSFVQARKEEVEGLRNIAVLCRFKAQQPLVAMALDAARIPRTPLLRYRLFSDRGMRLLRTYLELVRDPQRVTGEVLAAVINRPNRYVKNEVVAAIKSAPHPWEAFCVHLDRELDGDPFRRNAARDLRDRADALHEKLATDVAPLRFIDEVIDAFLLENFWRDERSPAGKEQDDGDPLELLNLIRIHAGEASSIDAFLASWDRRSAEEREQVGIEQDVLGREHDEEADRVVISTMHASKGREYEAVVLFDYGADLGKMRSEQVEEERRVCYVGMTRARTSLLLTIDSNRPLHQFIRESIRPAQPREEERLASEKELLRGQVRDAAIDIAQAKQRLDEIAGGRERARLQAEQARDLEHAADLEHQLLPLESWLERSRLWHKLSGRRSRVDAQAAPLRNVLADVKARVDRRERDLTLLGAEPHLYREPFDERQVEAETRRRRAEHDLAALDNRLAQLRLLSS